MFLWTLVASLQLVIVRLLKDKRILSPHDIQTISATCQIDCLCQKEPSRVRRNVEITLDHELRSLRSVKPPLNAQ
jgi:hypothetical protein